MQPTAHGSPVAAAVCYSPFVSLLTYAEPQTRQARLPRRLTGWCFVAGVLTLATLANELLSAHFDGGLRGSPLFYVFSPLEGPRWFPDLMMRLLSLPHFANRLGGIILLVAGFMAVRNRQARHALLVVLIRTAAIVMLLGQLGRTVCSAWFLYRDLAVAHSVFSNILYAVFERYTDLLPPIALLMAASRRFLADPQSRRRGFGVMIGIWGTIALVAIAYQLRGWWNGGQPYWMMHYVGYETAEPLVRAWDWLDHWGVWASRLVTAIPAVVAATLLIASATRGCRWLRVYAVGWTVLVAIPVAGMILLIAAGVRTWYDQCWVLADQWLHLPVALMALLLIRPATVSNEGNA